MKKREKQRKSSRASEQERERERDIVKDASAYEIDVLISGTSLPVKQRVTSEQAASFKVDACLDASVYPNRTFYVQWVC